MAEQVLYRKHRPIDFNEVVGQKHVVTAITNSLKTGRVAHAYLFSGPRGVGKTTCARLIAKALNCADARRPCNRCDSCEKFNKNQSLNLVEIDAASNRGVDDIKELRQGVRVTPSEGKYKTYIIDEVHQLSRDAFNALLKTLEEPPSHAVFILATTEIDKVPSTIISRTQHYSFHRPTIQQLVTRLEILAKKENITLDKEAAHLIALAAEGSLRDAESILGQVMSLEDRKITRLEVENILAIPRIEAVKKMFEHIAKKDLASALALIQELDGNGYDLSYFTKLLLRYFRSALLLKTDPSLEKFLEDDLLPDERKCLLEHLPAFREDELARGMNTILLNLQLFKKSPISQLPLEITIIEIIRGN